MAKDSDISSGTLLVAVFAIIIIIISLFYFRREQFVDPDLQYEDLHDEMDPVMQKRIDEIRNIRQDLEQKIGKIDDRLREIRETNLGGHSSAYFTRELNELTMQRRPLANTLDSVIAEEKKLGAQVQDYINAVNAEIADAEAGENMDAEQLTPNND